MSTDKRAELGVLADTSYISIGDPYTNKQVAPASTKGKQMSSGSTHSRSAAMDGYFDNSYPRVMEGEASFDAVKAARRARAESKKKNIVTAAFVPSSVPKALGGAGNIYGTFAGKVEHMDARSTDPKPYEKEKRNLYTNPAKKGTGYGYIGVTIGDNVKYESEAYDAAHEKALKEAKEDKEKIKGGAFKTHTAGQDLFDENPFKDEKSSARSPPPEVTRRERTKTVPFYASRPGLSMSSKYLGTFDKYPTHSEEPPAERPEKGSNETKKIFRPPMHVRTRPVKSIIALNVTRSINARSMHA